jgi:4-amino-4-deoxy-L-arabinose transferase-like glycosyltransferase
MSSRFRVSIGPPSRHGRSWPLVLLLIAVALVPRIYQLGQVPPGLSGDETFNAIDAARIGWSNMPVYFSGNNGREALFLYLVRLSTWLLGQSVFALRLPAALLGLGSVLLTYGIGIERFNRRVGFLGAALMAVSLWPIMHSRWTLRAVSLTFFTALTIYLLQHGLRSGRLRDWIAGGLAAGLTLYTYIPARVFPVVLVAWLLWVAFSQPDVWRASRRRAGLALLVALAVFAPFGRYMIQQPDAVNQRINSMTNVLDQVRGGDPGALVDAVGNVLRMFTFSGDPGWKYHLAGRPVFDPLTGLFFYLGLVFALSRAFRRHGARARSDYALLLLWMGAMIAPNLMLRSPDTSFLRAAGAVVPVYLVTGVGLDAAYGWLERTWPALRRPWLPLLVSAGLLATAAVAWQGYFVTWQSDPVVRLWYRGDLALVGRYLEAHPPPEGTRVYIGYGYVVDLAPRTFTYYSDRGVTWFTHSSVFPWNEGPAESWYFIPTSAPLAKAITARLPSGLPAQAETYSDGTPAFVLLRPGQISWRPTYPAAAGFLDGPRLVGYDLQGPLYRGEKATLLTYWEIPAGSGVLPNELTYVKVELEDQGGDLWPAGDQLLGYPQAGWQPGDRFVQLVDLEVPGGMPPGAVTPRVTLHRSDGRLYDMIDRSPEPGARFVILSRPLTGFQPAADDPVFGGVLALTDAAFSTLLSPGLPLNLSLTWVALEELAVDYQVRLQLVWPDQDRPVVTETNELWPALYPPSRWQRYEQVTTHHRLPVPLDIPTDSAPSLYLQVIDPSTGAALPLSQGSDRLAEMTLSLRDHLFERPAVSYPVDAHLGDAIVLFGYDLDTSAARAGGRVVLTLYWQALDTPADSYTVFNHLVALTGETWGQFDSPPVGDAWLTSTWLPGEVVVERREIPIRPGAPDGLYALRIGLYVHQTGDRLPVQVGGAPQPGDQLELTTITLGP